MVMDALDGYNTLEALPGAGCLSLASTCFGRYEQAMTALAVNITVTWRFRDRLHYTLVTFGDDNAPSRELQDFLRPAIECGMLTLASGGTRLVAALATGEAVAMPLHMRHMVAGATREAEPRVERLAFWHASIGKNTAHEAALWADSTSVQPPWLVCNLDCDNIVTADYIRQNFRHFAEGNRPGAITTCGAGTAGALTGRMCYRHVDFAALGGYDEACLPMGGQDVDYKKRTDILRRRTINPGHSLDLTTAHVCGGALPNDPDRRVDRGEAKIAHVDPALRRLPYGRTWNAMNLYNWQQFFGPRLRAGEMERNVGNTCIGAQWGVVAGRHGSETREGVEAMTAAMRRVAMEASAPAARRRMPWQLPPQAQPVPPLVAPPRARGGAPPLAVSIVSAGTSRMVHVRLTNATPRRLHL
jgi:hypothetical protein